jgi:hypothetical protein
LLGEERSDIVESARAIASEYGFDIWVGYADTCLGWLKHLDGDSAAGLDLMEQGLAAWQAAGAKAFAPGRMGSMVGCAWKPGNSIGRAGY